jgi:hypothetical protein
VAQYIKTVSFFSERENLRPKRAIQSEKVDQELRTDLWNLFLIYYWTDYMTNNSNDTPYGIVFALSWTEVFRLTLDTIPKDKSHFLAAVKTNFFSARWYRVYDFIECLASEGPEKDKNQRFMDRCNEALKHNMAAFRFVNGKIARLTSEDEILEIEQAIKVPLPPVRKHIQQALVLLSDRQNPDYRNSVKESISAIESFCKLVTRDEKSSLTPALDKLSRQAAIHPALKEAFTNLYHYTSDADGIRHALLGESNTAQEDAQFMLVACSAFINYMTAKASKAGISLA